MKSILSVFIVAVFLSSQIGLTLATHYCGGKVSKRSLGINIEDLSCGMENEESPSCENNKSIVRNNCCEDDVQSFKLSDVFKTQKKEVEVNQPLALSFIIVFFDLVNFNSENHSKYLNYHPPILKRDIPILIQSFLI